MTNLEVEPEDLRLFFEKELKDPRFALTDKQGTWKTKHLILTAEKLATNRPDSTVDEDLNGSLAIEEFRIAMLDDRLRLGKPLNNSVLPEDHEVQHEMWATLHNVAVMAGVLHRIHAMARYGECDHMVLTQFAEHLC